MLQEHYNILLVEDNPDDAELVKLCLKNNKLNVNIDVLTTLKEIRCALNERSVDIVLSDYNLDGFTGMEALKIVKDYDSDLPFILVTGYLDTKKAISIMVEGADDYIMKDELDRLVPVVAREVKSYEELKRSKNRLEAAYRLANIGHWHLDLTSNTLFWSNEVKKIHEVSEGYIPNLVDALLFYSEGDHRDRIKNLIDDAIRNKNEYEVESLIETAKGNKRWVRSNGKPEFRNGQCVALFGSVQDITEQKNNELALLESEQKLRHIIENSTNLFYKHDLNHKLTYTSPQSEYFFGLTPKEAMRDWREVLTDHPENEKAKELTKKAIESGKVQPSYKVQIKRKDGEIIWARVNEAPVVENGKTISIVGSLTDITQLIEVEKQQQVLAKVASETENIVIITDSEQNIEWVNDAFTDETGYTFEEVSGKNPRFLQGPDTDPDAKALISEAISNAESVVVEILNYTKNDEPYWIRLQISPMFNDRGEVERFFSISENITERKEYIRRLNNKRERLEESQRLGKIGDWDYDLKTGKVTWSRMLYDIYERDPNLPAPSYEENINYYFEDKELFINSVQKAIENAIPFSYDIKIRTEKGNIKYVHSEGVANKDQTGDVVMLHGIVQDITDYKQTKEELKNERDRLLEAQSIGKIGDWTYNYKTDKVFWSDQLYLIFERDSAKDPLTRDELFSSYIENSEELRSIVAFAHKNKTHYEYDAKINTETGKEKYIHIQAYPVLNNQGEIETIEGIVQDITDRKLVEIEINQKNKQLESISSNVRGFFIRYVLKPNGEDFLEYVSSGINRVHGLTQEQVLQDIGFMWEQIIGKHKVRLRSSIQESAEKLTPWREEWEIETNLGDKKWVKALGFPERRKDGEIVWDTFIQDVTDWFEAEIELGETLKFSATILETLPGHFFMVNEELKLLRWNQNTEIYYKNGSINIDGKKLYELFDTSEKDKIYTFINNIEKDKTAHIEIEHSINSRTNTFYLTGRILDTDNEPYFILTAIDITERIEAERQNDTLVQEVHHRVKNNLAIITGLLELQLAELSEKKRERLPLERAITRIHSISEVHKLLHEDSNLVDINVESYLNNLFCKIIDTIGKEKLVKYTIEASNQYMNVNELTPLGMLVNELFTNSLKYAVSSERKGEINISVAKNDNIYFVSYKDSGPGMNPEVFENSEGSGINIVRLLLKQLEADYKLNTDDGFGIEFTFKEKVRGAHSNLK